MGKYYKRPSAGDIVQCRYPQDKVRAPGPKERPALVTRVQEYELEDGSREVFVEVAYGTSEDVNNRYPGEFTVKATDVHAGLAFDTKFDIGNRTKLPFDDEWFAPSPNKAFGEHPKRGVLNLDDPDHKRQLQSAVMEARNSKRDSVEDMSPKPKGKKVEP